MQNSGHEKTNPKRWLALIAISLGVFMALIDTTVVNVALPSIQTSLNASYSDLQWVISSYTIVFSVLLLIWAKLGDLYGRKLMFMIGLVIFTIGSGLDAESTTIGMLHIFRAIQAIGGSALMSLSFALIGTSFDGKERGIALGILSSIIGLSTASGPLLGGWLVEAFSWQSVFTINLPVGVVTLILAWLFISNKQVHHASGRVDFLGMLEIMQCSAQAMFLFALCFKNPDLYQEEEIRFVVVKINGKENDIEPEIIFNGKPVVSIEITPSLIKSVILSHEVFEQETNIRNILNQSNFTNTTIEKTRLPY
ncbi:MFS transporter [Leuconostoc mesenteroides]|uniref:MFS transporter n=1 Tax=Leuconostoc mesenteroides TaxID=1245 RepID=UPI000A55C9EC|nr:MFS transporter [Leuconostoc mesenteroides]